MNRVDKPIELVICLVDDRLGFYVMLPEIVGFHGWNWLVLAYVQIGEIHQGESECWE